MKRFFVSCALIVTFLVGAIAQTVEVKFSVDFTETDLSYYESHLNGATLDQVIENKGLYVVYGLSESWSGGEKLALSRVGETWVYAGTTTLQRDMVYEYYFQVGTDGYIAENKMRDEALLAPGYYRWIYTRTDADRIETEALTFDGNAPAGKYLLRVRLDLTDVPVSDQGVYVAGDFGKVALVDTDALTTDSDGKTIYEGLIYGDKDRAVTYTFYNGAVSEENFAAENRYTVLLTEDLPADPVKYVVPDPGNEAAGHPLYDPAFIQKIEIHFAQDNWDEILDAAKQGEGGYTCAEWVKINGVRFDSVGVKYKGNSSYDPAQVKNPLHIALDEFKEDNDKYQGIKDLKLANVFGDASFIREVLSYEILSHYMICPRANFAKVYINGTYIGLYSNTEPVNKAFCNDRFGSKKNTFISCSPESSPDVTTKSNLKYRSDNPEDYYAAYEMKSDTGWDDLVALCDSVTNRPGSLDRVLDLDKFLWMLAFNNVTVNLDSYNGVYSQNYYLYNNSEGFFMPVPWDMNMSFGGFNYAGSGLRMGALDVAGRQQLPLTHHAGDEYWPVVKAVLENDRWRKMYIAHARTIFDEFFADDQYLVLAEVWQQIADAAVAADENKFYSYEYFTGGLLQNYKVNGYDVPGIKTLMDARKTYLTATDEFKARAPEIGQVGIVEAENANEAVFSVTVSDAASVFLYVRNTGTANGRFTACPMTNTEGGIYTASVSIPDAGVEYYIYADNESAGMFSPRRAAKEFYTYVPGNGSGTDETCWLNETGAQAFTSAFWNPFVGSSYVGPETYEVTGDVSMQVWTGMRIETFSTGSEGADNTGAWFDGRGVCIRDGSSGETGISFTVPDAARFSAIVSSKGDGANRVCRIYRKIAGQAEELIGDCGGLDLNSWQAVEEQTDSDRPVTYRITGSDDTRKPAVLAAVSIKKYDTGQASVPAERADVSVRYDRQADALLIRSKQQRVKIILMTADGKQLRTALIGGDGGIVSLAGLSRGMLLIRTEEKDRVTVSKIIR